MEWGQKKSVETSEGKQNEEKKELCFYFSLKQLWLWNHILQCEFQSNFLKEGDSFKRPKGSRSLFQVSVTDLIYIFKSESSNWLNYYIETHRANTSLRIDPCTLLPRTQTVFFKPDRNENICYQGNFRRQKGDWTTELVCASKPNIKVKVTLRLWIISGRNQT